MQIYPICFDCKHLHDGDELTCAAFPEGIPEEILYDPDAKHNQPLEDQDNEIVFEEDA